MLTQEYLKTLFNYDKETGLLYWKVARSNRANIHKPINTKNSHGYVIVSIDKVRYGVHRVIWIYVTGVVPSGQIDHINGVRDDNRWLNLRDVSRAYNQQNRDTLTKMVGTSWNRLNNNWRAQININNKVTYLGSFNTQEEAYHAYLEAKQSHHLGYLGR